MPNTAAPFRQFVIKVHSRCDLACDYCYMYESVDQSWRARPRILALDTAALIGKRVARHARAHGLDEIRYILHGGEPLLSGAHHLGAVIDELRRPLDGIAAVDLRIHTNGVLLDRDFCDLFVAQDVSVGISLDGDRAANDQHRRYADGRTSYPRVLAALALLRQPEYRHLYAGILCTIDLANDPVAVYEALKAEEPPRIDLLLPHATWDNPPTRPLTPDARSPSTTAYADWLLRIYERWTGDGRPFGIRIFDSISSTLAGGPALTETLGLTPSDLLVIETDGDIEQVDSLKVAYEGAAATGLSVLDRELDAAALHPGVASRRRGLDGLNAQCRACPVVTTCGGGFYPHRYRSESGFKNPSVYCEDLLHLISHVARTERSGMPSQAESAPVSIAAAHLDELKTGFGGAGAVTELVRAQQSLNRLLLAKVGLRGTGSTSSRAVWDVLVELDANYPEAVAASLRHPYFRSWAVKNIFMTADSLASGHLAALAVCAAFRAGAEIELEVPVYGASVPLPGLGRFMVAPGVESAWVQTAHDALVFCVGARRWKVFPASTVGSGSSEARWQPTITLTSQGISVRLEDTDPERDCHQWPVSDRLDGSGHAAWQARFDEAWHLILRDHAAYAPGLAAGLHTITPLAARSDGHEVSAAARQAFGAVGAALPERADRLALLLIHEFQHVKLGAVLDLYDLYDEEDRRLYYAPWRDDLRPLEGLLQGTYAHVAVTDFWRVRRSLDASADAVSAEIEFAHWRAQSSAALDTLASSGSLTPIGTAFVDGMRATLAPWLAEPVSSEAETAARLRSQRHQAAYLSTRRRSVSE